MLFLFNFPSAYETNQFHFDNKFTCKFKFTMDKVELEASDTTAKCQSELLADAIDEIGMGSYQWKLFFLCGVGWMCDCMYTQVISVMVPQVQKEFKLTNPQSSYIQSAIMFGMMIGIDSLTQDHYSGVESLIFLEGDLRF